MTLLSSSPDSPAHLSKAAQWHGTVQGRDRRTQKPHVGTRHPACADSASCAGAASAGRCGSLFHRRSNEVFGGSHVSGVLRPLSRAKQPDAHSLPRLATHICDALHRGGRRLQDRERAARTFNRQLDIEPLCPSANGAKAPMHREPKLLNDNGVTIWSVCGRDKRVPPQKANSANGRDALVASEFCQGF